MVRPPSSRPGASPVNHKAWGDARPSDRAGPLRRVGLLSVHTSPLEQPGAGDSGGMNVYLTSLARQLRRRGIAVDVFTRSTGTDLPPTVHLDDGVAVHHISAGPSRAAKSELASHLCAFYLTMAGHPQVAELDVVHGHYWMGGWVGRHLRRRYGMPLIQSFHTLGRVKNSTLAPGDQPEPALRLAAEDRIVRDADAVIAGSAHERAVLEQCYGASPSRVQIVPAGVDLEIFSDRIDRNRARQDLGGGRILLFVGRLQPLKGPDVAIRTLAALDRLLPADALPTRLVIVGGPSGPASDEAHPDGLRDLARKLGVADRVAILAARPQSELAALYRAADVVLVPSRSESFGLVALEAQACGTPVVAADVGGLQSIVGSGGTLVHTLDADAFARAAAPYLLDPRTRVAAAEAGRAMALAYGWDVTVDETLEVYQAVLGDGTAEEFDEERRGA
ncbi:MAG: glycosyltransferase [Nitriliruptorales bacterium]|nr:glycosyltransferase [Nitriliruptorales bacterium]